MPPAPKKKSRIVGGLTTPQVGRIPMENYSRGGTDYNQGNGDYTQSSGGNHEQGAGNYTQTGFLPNK